VYKQGGEGWRRRIRKDGVGEWRDGQQGGGGEGCSLLGGIIGKGNIPQ